MADELGLAESRAIVDQLAGMGVFEINFGGGEPLLKGHFLPLLDYIHGKGIVTCISTNGTVLNNEAIARFTGNPLVHVQISLDGATPEVNDRLRGEGTYRRILKGLERLAGRGISLSINTVVTALNFDQLDELEALAASYGARLRVSRFRPSGRAKASWDKLRLSAAQLEVLSDWLGERPGVLTGDSFFSISGEGRRGLGLDMCGAGRLTCCLDPIGSVYPCAFLQEDEFCAGDLRKATFREIWESSPVFLKFRRLEPASCRTCPRFDFCRGGCPAVARFVRKDIGSPDPECLKAVAGGHGRRSGVNDAIIGGG
jgi:mycofactocin radical SAM maturase